MPYVIFYPATSKYVKHGGTWAVNLKNASKFQSLEKVQNYMTNNFPFVFKGVPVDAVEILDTNNLTQGMMQDFAPPPTQDFFTVETAAEEMKNLKEFFDVMLEAASKFVALPSFYGNLVKTLDMETQDILHKIEFTNENVVNGFKRYKQLQDVRQRRREAKDALEMSSLLLSTGLLTSLKSMQVEIVKLERYMDKRDYTPRVLTELFDEQEEGEVI